MSLSGLQHYRKVERHGNLAEASPHQVVQVMLDAVLSRIAEASGPSRARRGRRRKARRSAKRSASSKR